MKIQFLTVAAAALTLAACQPAAEGGAEAAGDAATPAASEAPDSNLREGFWQTTMTVPGAPPMVSRMCVDAGMNAFSQGANNAASDECDQTVTQTANGMSFSSRCPMGASGTVSTEGTMTGDFQSNYRMEATVTTEGAAMAQMNGVQTVVTEAAYQGACPEGWRGGDMEIPGLGQRINIHDAQAQAAATPPA